MGKITGFLEFERVSETYEAPAERLKHYKEFVLTLDDKQATTARCFVVLDCGIPF
ncbi:hypothetical protein V757_12735 [Pelistega indica]|uniref:Uncharacterized protein n=1 Tax=Pelistega indica TaxID=1414851 RepID=V8FQC7_9BURK|nr:hypothetical protein V757_12735 [Pelistega indica]